MEGGRNLPLSLCIVRPSLKQVILNILILKHLLCPPITNPSVGHSQYPFRSSSINDCVGPCVPFNLRNYILQLILRPVQSPPPGSVSLTPPPPNCNSLQFSERSYLHIFPELGKTLPLSLLFAVYLISLTNHSGIIIKGRLQHILIFSNLTDCSI